MNILTTDIKPVPNFLERLQQSRANQEARAVATVPNVQQWLQYWNDDESYAGNLRNLQHWLTRARNAA